MKKILARIYGINLLLIVVLLVSHRIFLSTIKNNDSWIDTIQNIYTLWMNIASSYIFLIGALVTSLTIFLNNYKVIHNNRLRSLLTFSAIPFVGFVFMMIDSIRFANIGYKSPMLPLAVVLTVYFGNVGPDVSAILGQLFRWPLGHFPNTIIYN